MTVLEEILTIKKQTLADISQAAKSSDVTEVTRLSHRLARLDTLSKKASAVVEKLSLIKAEMGEPDPADAGHSLRVIEIKITGGMLRRHMLIVTPYKGQIDYAEEMLVTAPHGDFGERGSFATEFIKTGNRLRARGEIRAFYEMNHVKEGDLVILFETAPGQWSLETKAEYDKLLTKAASAEPVPAKPAPAPGNPTAKAPRPPSIKAGSPISEA